MQFELNLRNCLINLVDRSIGANQGIEHGGLLVEAVNAKRAGNAFERMHDQLGSAHVTFSQRATQAINIVVMIGREHPQQAGEALFTTPHHGQTGIDVDAGDQLQRAAQIEIDARQRRDSFRDASYRTWQPLEQGLVERIRVNRLGDKIVHPGIHAGLAVFREGICRHRQDRDCGRGGSRPNTPSRLKPIHHRHLHVHQDQVKWLLAHFLQGVSAIFGQDHCHPDILQQLHGHFLIDRIIFTNQQATAGVITAQDHFCRLT